MTKRMELPPGSSDERKSRGSQREGASFPVRPLEMELPSSYSAAFAIIKERIRTDRKRTILAANAAMVMLYWDIGKTILERQRQEGWGAKVIDRLSYDLCEAFPGMRGLSPRNLKYMRSFAAAWSDRQFVQQVAAQIPWFHNVVLLNKIKDTSTRLWYAKKAGEEGWSRSYVVIELKAVPFDPAFVGQMNLYLSAVDDLMRHSSDEPTIGLLLCKGKERVVVEYALRGVNKPMGVAEWETRLVDSLPAELKGSLPSVEEIEAELVRHETLKQ